MSTRPNRQAVTGRLDGFGQGSTAGDGGWELNGTVPIGVDLTDHGSDGPAANNSRGAVDPAIFGIDAADVGADPRTIDSSKDGVVSREPTTEESKLIESYSKIIENSFIWYAVEAKPKLDALRRDLKKVDPPHWSEQVASFVLESALGAGAQASGLALAAKLVTGDATREFLQNLFASGVTGGMAAGKAKLAGGSDDTVVDTFVDSQIEGVTKRQQGSQSVFILSGRQQLKSVSQARDLAAACDNGNAKEAAAHQYEASRDAWVSYVAQQTFGSVVSNEVGGVTTNMTNQASRDREHARKGEYMSYPKDAPDLKDAVLGHSAGVLTVVVDLPTISRVYDVAYGGVPHYTAAFEMNGSPKVAAAIMSGVNDFVRAQYIDRPLASCRIPRQVVARVSGDADFTLNLDEKGKPAHRPTDMKWLAARAVIAAPERSKFDDDDNHWEGMQLLLNDVRLAHIDDKLIW